MFGNETPVQSETETQRTLRLSQASISIVKDEIDAISQYLSLISLNNDINLDRMNEIIADELDHACIGLKMFIEQSGIEPKEYEIEKKEEM